MGELAVGAVDLTPGLGDGEDLVDLPRHQSVQRDPARGPVLNGANLTQTQPPAVHPIVADTELAARPGVRGAGGDRLVDQLEHRFFDLARDPCGQRTVQVQPYFPRSNASSIACAFTASVS